MERVACSMCSEELVLIFEVCYVLFLCQPKLTSKALIVPLYYATYCVKMCYVEVGSPSHVFE